VQGEADAGSSLDRPFVSSAVFAIGFDGSQPAFSARLAALKPTAPQGVIDCSLFAIFSLA
jgi:hypothetical protein